MLEGRHLKKAYKTKGGVEVHALDDISVIFPETGMVFLLGKSGSGKSTLLNVLGGLDKVDSGEIIIKGKNSKDFSSADFDSYRNTFIGFIFQEYNILNEFNIEQNISLALQLQGKPNDRAAVDAILDQVDLKGMGKRKPNTLSGGQKQRVAIARALIKNPEIIMADEPTGALDSNTGKQVFDTLKKLSEKKLVIVVSHDRDFAEIYADRIIELSDGKIISDVTKEHVASKAATENVSIVRENVVAIKDASKITEADLRALVGVLKNQKGEVILTSGSKDVPLVKQAIRIKDDNSSEVFNDTKDVGAKQYDGKQTKFIRSHLPAARAMKMGISSVKTKPIRMIFTTFLTTIALTMFGVASALMLFRESYSVSRALQSSHYTAEFVEKQVDVKYAQYEEDVATETVTEQYSYNSTEQGRFSKAELERLSRNGLKFAGVFGEDINIQDRTEADTRLYNLYPKFYGLSDAGKSFINDSGFSFVAGDYPEAVDEIAITQYLYKSLQKTYNVTEESQIVGKILKLNGNKYKITGVINVGEIPNKYSEFDKETITLNEKEARELEYDFGCYMQSSFHCIGFVSDEFFEANNEKLNLNPSYKYDDFYSYSYDCYGLAFNIDIIPTWDISEDSFVRILLDDKYEDYKESVTYYDLDGNVTNHQQLSDNATYVPYYWYNESENEVKNNLCEAARQLLTDCSRFDSGIYSLNDNQRQELLETIERYRNYFQWADGYPSDYDIDDDYTTIKTFVDDHYANVVDKIYFFYKARLLRDTFYNRKDVEGIDETDYLPIFDMINDIDVDEPYDFTHYDEIKDFLIADKDKVLYHYDLVRVASNNNNISSPTINEIANKFYNGEVVIDSEYDYLKNFIDNLEPIKINFINYVEADRTTGYQEIDTAFDYTLNKHSKVGYKSYNGEKGLLDIAGYYSAEYYDSGLFIFTKNFIKANGKLSGTRYYSQKTSTYVEEENSIYRGAISNTNYSMEQVDVMLQDFGDHRIRMTDSTYASIAIFVNLIATLKTIFLIIGAVFGVFAALMLLNFISSSITSKIKEIGILRAVGARGSDLFKIFFSESGFVSLICIVISIIASFFICRYLNAEIAGNLGFQMLNFGIINIGLVIAGAAVIAFVGTFIPVLIASKKPPVESIRTL